MFRSEFLQNISFQVEDDAAYLIVKSSIRDDAGPYKVVLKNRFGGDTVKLNVNVLGKTALVDHGIIVCLTANLSMLVYHYIVYLTANLSMVITHGAGRKATIEMSLLKRSSNALTPFEDSDSLFPS